MRMLAAHRQLLSQQETAERLGMSRWAIINRSRELGLSWSHRPYKSTDPRVIDWTDLDPLLKQMTADAVPTDDIAARLGVGRMTVLRRRKKLGIMPGKRGRAKGCKDRKPRDEQAKANVRAARLAWLASTGDAHPLRGKPLSREHRAKIAAGIAAAAERKRKAANKPYLGITASTGLAGTSGRRTVSITHAGPVS